MAVGKNKKLGKKRKGGNRKVYVHDMSTDDANGTLPPRRHAERRHAGRAQEAEGGAACKRVRTGVQSVQGR